MYLSVQHAARRLGVSPHTIRRWTASGFLPCTRTAGGHRRIKQEDIDELAHLIGGSNHLAARLARERELETLVSAAIAVSSHLDLGELLREIARHMTTVLDMHTCVVSEYDPATKTVSVLAEYDHQGNRRPDDMRYTLNQFPMAKKAIEEHETILINVSDPHADPAEVAVMRRDGDKCLLILPLVHQGQSIGLIEVLDHHRERRLTRQEMRLARAIAGQAAVALHNAMVFARLRRADRGIAGLRRAVRDITAAHSRLVSRTSPEAVLQEAATLSAEALQGISCVASWGDLSAGASGLPAELDDRRGGATAAGAAQVVVASAPCAGKELTLTLTITGRRENGERDLLGLVATLAADALARVAA